MDKKTLENNIKKNYKIVQNYLNGDPGAEGFLNSLAKLQTDFANYLIMILKTKKYGKDDTKKSNIYQGHIRGGNEKYIDNEKLEQIISNKVLGKKVSVNSLLDEGIKKLEELFDTQKSFENALKSGKLQSIQLNKVILPSDDLPAPTTGNSNFNKKELSQNKLWLFVSTLRELGIYDDDLIIYSGKLDDNMMRENTYYAIFIPRINKTVFLNTGYWEATFVCEGEISIEQITTLGKEKLQDKLGAIKINFFENSIKGRKKKLNDALLGNGGKIGKKVEVRRIRNNINKSIELEKLKQFFIEHKNDTFIDSDGEQHTIEYLFSKLEYYKKNYKKLNEQYSLEVGFPGNPSNYFNIKWNDFLKKLGIEIDEREIVSLKDLKDFYSKHKNDTFIDSDGTLSTIEKLFSNFDYYLKNYKEFNKNLDIKLPGNPTNYYNAIRSVIRQKIGIEINEREIISLDDLKAYFTEHKNDKFTDSSGQIFTIEDLFSKGLNFYIKNYKIINKHTKIRFPAEPNKFYNIGWHKLQQKLGINKDIREIISLEDLKSFYAEHKDYSFTDSDGNPSNIEELFSNNLDYYTQNYGKINEAFLSDFKLSRKPTNYYNITWNQLIDKLNIKKDNRKIISLDGLKSFYIAYKNDSFIDSDENPSTIEKLFSNFKYYQKNFEIINETFQLEKKLSANPKLYYKLGRKKIKSYIKEN